MRRWRSFWVIAGIWLLFCCSQAMAVEINDKISIDGVLAGAYQHQSLSDAPGYEDSGRGGLAFQPSINMKLTDIDEVHAKFGFGAGNGLADGTSPFNLNPWAVDLESSVKGINGRDRDYLLTANYLHKLDLDTIGQLSLTGGLIDATLYLDQNVYANCAYNQFLNAALVNGPNVFLPSYDLGAAAEWSKEQFSAALVVMNVGQNDNGENFNFFGAQFGYTLETGLGEGHYRLNVNKTTDDFDGPNGTTKKSKIGVLASCDQELNDIFGVWVRLGWQDDAALINYKNLISGGLNIKGSPWARQMDNIGIGYAFLDDGNNTIDSTNVLEVYYRWALNEFSAVTLDFQYMEDKYLNSYSPKGLISGLRFTAAF
ncbi:MAG: carbohydrate porin [Desulfobacteraceae bacterium]|nr:carbohydrate porin [Desulfobacteraceae bacterium]